MGVTIADVSRVAGVSIKTVSRVLNNEKYVAEATRARVDAAASALGYRPSFAARALAGRRSFQIALIYDNPSPYYAQNIQAGVRDRCAEDGYRMIAQPCDSGSSRLIEEIGGLIDQAQLDGIILTPPFTERSDVRDALEQRGVRYVMVSPATQDEAIAATFMDQEAASAAMTSWLIAQGHRRIGFVMGDERYASSHKRHAGYQHALRVAGIDYAPALVQPGKYDFESGSQAAQALLTLDPAPTAIFASSDDMAAGVLATAHQMGFNIPKQLSVAGFDDTDLAAVVWPPLTTIRQPVRALGRAAADLLFQLPDMVEQRLLAHELIVRSSTAKR
jgi:LacI family transcriptional regulator